ncbi:hypothetical protein JF66_09225 [Cryobacterium sp. MLB-32]|uniref:hypothetical protein n=1 Tax=Cryobacterium sp. MLB-32 TaxID=1529318 RepID=UPI0004E784D1|nr:hypothetical protein [Cryobacterium sp. MLB-32]KFF59751.1 hypothetical protein JF66_09225 [Cryobacterium sp. MLB-32]
MTLSMDIRSMADHAHLAATDAARVAGVLVVDERGLPGFTKIENLFSDVWGLPLTEPPIPAELLRSISHAGCNVTAAYDAAGTLTGAAVAIVAPGNVSMYSLIAGVVPGTADRGVGFALKLHQRAWALARGIPMMTWTFDPLVSRNARFNLTKLGAHADEYEQDFYGPMHGLINANDESDRLIAVWPLADPRAVDCSQGLAPQPEFPAFTPDDVRGDGPDGDPAVIDVAGVRWCRVPEDIVAVRAENPALAAAWRRSIRSVFTELFAAGYTADGVTRSGWYRFVSGGQA